MLRKGKKSNFREFLTVKAEFHNILNLKDNHILTLIRQNFVLKFLKDTVAARFLEDSTMRNIFLITGQNHVSIIEFICSKEETVNKLISLVRSSERAEQLSGLGFIFEFCSSMKEYVNVKRTFWNVITKEYSALSLFLPLLSAKPKEQSEIVCSEKRRCSEMAIFLLQEAFQANGIELSQEIMQEEDCETVQTLFEVIENASETSIKTEISEILKNILEIEIQSEASERLNAFCSKLFGMISKKLAENEGNSSKTACYTFEIFVDFLCRVIRSNWENSKYFLSFYDLLPKVAKLFKFPSKSLRVGVIKFFKLIIEMNVVI